MTPQGVQPLNRSLAQGDIRISCTNRRTIEINPTEFLPSPTERSRWNHYFGSLTGDPFSEDVRWFVMANEIAVSADDVDNLMAAADHHARKVQAFDDLFHPQWHKPGSWVCNGFARGVG